MELQTCRITLSNEETITFSSVEDSLEIIDTWRNNNISHVEISATDGRKTHRFLSESIEESIENLMNL